VYSIIEETLDSPDKQFGEVRKAAHVGTEVTSEGSEA
jgi:hypothetical protein